MKSYRGLLTIFLITLTPLLQSCELAGDIFGAGVWIGVSIVLIIIFVVLWLFNKVRK